jgi:mono/diheme cytochrome c family protein
MRRRTALALFVLGLAIVALAGCGGGEEAAPLPETVEGTVGEAETEAEETETEGGETQTGETEAEETTEEGGGGGGAQGNAEAGATIFNEQGCGGCHVLEAAGSSGSVGPNLDESQPDLELIVDRVTNGKGVMPAFRDELSEEEIQNVSAYVFESTHGS